MLLAKFLSLVSLLPEEAEWEHICLSPEMPRHPCPLSACTSGPPNTFGHTDLCHLSGRTCGLGKFFL